MLKFSVNFLRSTKIYFRYCVWGILFQDGKFSRSGIYKYVNFLENLSVKKFLSIFIKHNVFLLFSEKNMLNVLR